MVSVSLHVGLKFNIIILYKNKAIFFFFSFVSPIIGCLRLVLAASDGDDTRQEIPDFVKENFILERLLGRGNGGKNSSEANFALCS